jgi:AmmeMemoRadiSam system protein B
MQAKIRMPVVAGSFYPAQAGALRKLIGSFAGSVPVAEEAIACMLPHAGYPYSGPVAVEAAGRIRVRERVVLLGPNHTGAGAPMGLMRHATWLTPLGAVETDEPLADAILKGSRLLQEDELAHKDEHSLEVELPVLQYFNAGFKIVPIAFLSGQVKALKQAGLDIAGAVKRLKAESSTLLVASSDMTHYEPEPEARRKDKLALDAILRLDEEALARAVAQNDISMCGLAPVIVMLSAAKALGARKAELAGYRTSAQAGGDSASVVGYAGVIIR